MSRNDRLSAMFDGPSPSVRRQDGIRDARMGRPRASGDRDYGVGYDLGSQLSRTGQAVEPTPRTNGGSGG